MKKSHLKEIIILSSLAVILVLAVVILKPNTSTESSESAEINGFKLEKNETYGTAKIVGYDKENKYIKAAETYEIGAINNAKIPETVQIESKNYYITEIGENAFSNSTVFKTITIPETVEKIGSGAFTNCPNLTKVVLSSAIETSVSDAFDTTTENPNLVFSYNGEDIENATELENKIIVGLKSSEVINIGKVQWNNSKAQVELSTEYEKYTIQYRVNSGEWKNGATVSNLNVNDKVEARLAYGESYSIEEYATYTVAYENDTTKPTVSLAVTNVTDSTITVEATASDEQSGLTGQYKWYSGSTLKGTTETNTYTFEGLTDYTSYTLKVEVSDNCSNTATATKSAKTEIILSNHNSSSLISFSNFKYNSAGYYTIDIKTSAPKGTLLYQVNGYADDGWQTIANNGTISNLSNGDVVYAKITDVETSSTGYASYTVVDNDPVINSFREYGLNYDSFGVQYMVKDDLGIESVKIYIDGKEELSEDGYGNKSESDTHWIYGLDAGRTYEVMIEVTDVTGKTVTQTIYIKTLDNC